MKYLIFDSPFRDSLLPPLLSLLQCLLEQHFQYFMKSSMSVNGIREKTFTSEVAYNYFIAILEAIKSILQNEAVPPRITKQVFLLLQRINSAHRLFALAAFQQTVRDAYIQTMLKVHNK